VQTYISTTTDSFIQLDYEQFIYWRRETDATGRVEKHMYKF